MPDSSSSETIVALTAQLVSSYVGNNEVPLAELPDVIRTVYAALQSECGETTPAAERKPAVPIKRSVMPDHLICLEDGKSFKTLRRHLRIDHDTTPEAYRERWSLPDSYPMTAPGYAVQRSFLAKKSGLGRRPPAEPVSQPAPSPAETTAKRSRPRAAA